MAEDPAETARQRAGRAADLIGKAEEIEARAGALPDPTKLEDVVPMNALWSGANNLRLRALCLHHRVPGALSPDERST